MRRFLAIFALFIFALPVGLSVSGCSTQVGDFCNGLGYGVKTDAVTNITLQPEYTGLSLSWGQTGQISSPSATNCHGKAATVSTYTYGSSNLLLADISPTGAICGGTWNRNSPGGITDFTICTPPTGSSTQQCTSTSCGVAQITASGAGVTSNPVPVYIHPPVSSIAINSNAQNGTCTSQNAAGPVFNINSAAGQTTSNVTVYGPNGTAIPAADVGTIVYTPVTPSVVTIDTLSSTGTGTNGATVANMPGSTVVNATVAQVSSSAGYFYTCPPTSLALTINGATTATVNANSPQNITAVATDKNGVLLSGLTLDYTSTRPQEIAVSAAGQVTTTYPSSTAITAICQPTTCNPSPIDQIGMNGNGTPVVSNTLNVNGPGRSSTFLWMASTQSQYFSQIDLTTGVPTSPIRLPYTPNSMVLDQAGNNLYFGSYRELMIYTATTNGLSKEDTTVPGVVMAVSPDSTTVVVNDQLRQVIYLYTTSTGTNTSIGGIGTHAEFSPDGKNVYIVGESPDGSNPMLYVHNANSGWSTYSLASTQPACTLNNNSPLATGTFDPFCGADVTLTIPSSGSIISGSATSAHNFCANDSASPIYYPPADLGAADAAATDKLATTNNGVHIFGANTTTFSDIGIAVPTGACLPITNTTTPMAYTTTLNPIPFTGITPKEIDQVIASPDSSVAFVTYTSASVGSGLLPTYIPSTTLGSAGAISNKKLSGAAQDPVSGIFSPDGTIFFVGTSGDNLVHFFDPVALTDTQTPINPGLKDANGTPVPVQMMAVKPRPTT